MAKCKYWDPGWCYHSTNKYSGCVGTDKCVIIHFKENEKIDMDNEEEKPDSPHIKYYREELKKEVDTFFDMLKDIDDRYLEYNVTVSDKYRIEIKTLKGDK